MQEIELALGVLIFVAACYVLSRRHATSKLPLPPGPKPLPIIGNINDIPREASWREFQKWGKKWGDITYFHTFGRPVIVLNSAAVARDLLEKRGSIYSYRPQFAMANEVIGWKFSVTSMDYGEKYKRQRKYMQLYLQKNILVEHQPLQLKECHRLLSDLLEDPENYRRHIQRMAGGITMMVTYGHEVKSLDDRFLRIAERGVQTIRAAGVIGAHIVDLIPWLRFLPHRLFIPPGTKEDLQRFLHTPFEQVKRQVADGTAIPSYTTALLEKTEGKDDEGVLGTAALIYSGGLDTTMSWLLSIFTQMVANPIIQARAQAEMDLVVGTNRLPDFSDRDKLPYIYCIVSETLRYAASTPVGVPHRLSEADTYNGYYLPAGSMVLANQWAMLHDENVYPDPETFNPDRFLQGEGRNPQPDPRGVAFGFGRRICPGRDLAESTVWAFLTSVFYAFRITPEVDAAGHAIPIDLEYVEGSVRHPKPFKCCIEPRRANSAGLIRQAKLSF